MDRVAKEISFLLRSIFHATDLIHSVRLAPDGSHTIVKNGGACVGYQKRKKANTTNLLFLADNQGLILACSEPVSGEHNDLYQIQLCFDELCLLLQQAEISLKGVL